MVQERKMKYPSMFLNYITYKVTGKITPFFLVFYQKRLKIKFFQANILKLNII